MYTNTCMCAYSTTYLYDSCMCICICHMSSSVYANNILRDDLFFASFLGRKPSLVEPCGLTFIVNALGGLAGRLQISWQSFGHDTCWTDHATCQARISRRAPLMNGTLLKAKKTRADMKKIDFLPTSFKASKPGILGHIMTHKDATFQHILIMT